ncbi:MAG: hypothetical protein R3F20_17680 [Planctomycetota bacterium]
MRERGRTSIIFAVFVLALLGLGAWIVHSFRETEDPRRKVLDQPAKTAREGEIFAPFPYDRLGREPVIAIDREIPPHAAAKEIRDDSAVARFTGALVGITRLQWDGEDLRFERSRLDRESLEGLLMGLLAASETDAGDHRVTLRGKDEVTRSFRAPGEGLRLLVSRALEHAERKATTPYAIDLEVRIDRAWAPGCPDWPVRGMNLATIVGDASVGVRRLELPRELEAAVKHLPLDGHWREEREIYGVLARPRLLEYDARRER